MRFPVKQSCEALAICFLTFYLAVLLGQETHLRKCVSQLAPTSLPGSYLNSVSTGASVSAHIRTSTYDTDAAR